MIPSEKSAAVRRGLSEAFGVIELEDIQKITRGLSSDLVFRIVAKGSPYLLRLMTRMDERKDPARIFACMRAAAEAGLAPRLWHTNLEDGISIMDFVEAAPFPVEEALFRIPGVLRRLHALPRFPKTFNFVTAHNGFIWRLRGAKLLPKDEVEEVFERYAQLCAVYPRLDPDMVSSHMDLKPENILFDGEHVWLVDWEAAFVNDRYFDLAVAANFVVTGDAEEKAYLREYFGQTADEYQRARFFLMRQALHMLSAAVFLLLASTGKALSRGEAPPSFREFHERIWAGEVNLADNAMKDVYGRVHWRRLVENMRHERFEEALRIVSERQAGEEGGERLFPAAAFSGAGVRL
jgi:aminoglycoside phosphotransferase (APT) family kinase protein